MLIHLCYHFYNHLQSGAILKMICDINEFILNYQRIIDWDKINNIRNLTHSKKEICIALTYAHVLLNTPVPQSGLLNRSFSSIQLSSIGRYTNRNTVILFYARMQRLKSTKDKGIFLWRTLFPVKAWMVDNKYLSESNNLIAAYLQYWHVMFNRHIYKKSEYQLN